MDDPGPAYAISIRGLKQEFGIDRTRLRDTLLAVLEAERAPAGELAVALIGDRTMRRINRDYRQIDKTTDVLSFSYVDEPHSGGVLGEIFVSPAVARAQAEEAGCPLGEEVARLALHGLLHVLGYE
ncbi:MAG: rRNA maturation RNase YbeY, partial [Gemmatimonadetes bacterium]|nr:rRNA maturation RNase YbeY [Gemmatimonadota bacterium]